MFVQGNSKYSLQAVEVLADNSPTLSLSVVAPNMSVEAKSLRMGNEGWVTLAQIVESACVISDWYEILRLGNSPSTPRKHWIHFVAIVL